MPAKVDFHRMDLAHLRHAASPLCMDDQWFPSRELRTMGVLRGPANTARAIVEFKRSLLSSEQVLVNRSYLVNGDAISTLLERDDDPHGLKPGKDRLGLERMLNRHDIVAFLLDDTGPELDEARGRVILNTKRLGAWHAVLKNTRVACLRLSWDDDARNREAIRTAITDRFAARLLAFAATGAPVLAALASGRTTLEECRDYLTRSFRPALDRELAGETGITRSGLYRALVMVDRSSLADSVVDHGKPFACAIKEAIDLVYNTTLTDATKVVPITPQGSPGRHLLSEDGDIAAEVSAKDAAAVIAAIGRLTQTQAVIDRYASLLNTLSLETICQIRELDAWQEHVQLAADLAAQPASLAGRALVDEIEDRVVRAQASGERLGREIIVRFLRDWPESRGAGPAAYRFGISTAFGKVGGSAIAAAGGALAASGPGLDNVAAIAGFGAISAQALDDLKGLALRKVRQQIDLRLGWGTPFVAACLPRLQLADPKETAADVVRLLERDAPMIAGQIAAPSPDAAADAATGHRSTLSVPQYG